MFTYRWTGLDLVTGETFRSPKRYYSPRSLEKSIELYIAKHLSDRDPEDYVFDVIKTDSFGRKFLVHAWSKTDPGAEVFIYYWWGLDLETGELIPSPERHYSLGSVERSIESYIADRDPEDLMFEVIKIDECGRESIVCIKTKRDLGEGVGIKEWYCFLNLMREDMTDLSVEEAHTLVQKIKRDDIGDMDVEGLDPSQELKLANMVHRMKKTTDR